MIIHDAIYSSIKIDDKASEIIGTREFQRLNTIKQLGFSYLVFPGATHTRFEHSLGTYYLAREAAKNLEMNSSEIAQVSIAGLLHDLGHAPFSHSIEEGVESLYGKDHVEVAIDIITGEEGSGKIPSILKEDLDDVAKILQNKKGIQSRLISGNGDMDQIDYLARDSYYTGVALGAVDVSRILNTIHVFNNEFCVLEKGLPALEGLMLARMLMYRTVYRYKLSLIASTIANEAFRSLSPSYEEFITWDDCDFLSEMKRNDKTRETYRRIKERSLPPGLVLETDRKQFDEVRSELGDYIETSSYFSSPYKTEAIKILDGKELKPITELSGIMHYLEQELQGSGIIVFNKENEERLRAKLLRREIKFQ